MEIRQESSTPSVVTRLHGARLRMLLTSPALMRSVSAWACSPVVVTGVPVLHGSQTAAATSPAPARASPNAIRFRRVLECAAAAVAVAVEVSIDDSPIAPPPPHMRLPHVPSATSRHGQDRRSHQ